jgi:hypothetical protein
MSGIALFLIVFVVFATGTRVHHNTDYSTQKNPVPAGRNTSPTDVDPNGTSNTNK